MKNVVSLGDGVRSYFSARPSRMADNLSTLDMSRKDLIR